MRLIPFPIALLVAGPLVLSTAASATEVIRLSAAERDAVLDAAANGPERQPMLTPEQTLRPSVLDRSLYPELHDSTGLRDRKVHGQVTMFAGSGGTLGMGGTAVMPLGDTGTAAVSILTGTSRWGGMQGFNLGYASDGPAFLSGGFSNGFGASLGGPGHWNSPYGYARPPGPPPRRR